MKAVNLLADERRQSLRRPGRAALGLALAVAVAVIATAAAYLQAEDRAATNDERVATLQRQVAMAEEDSQPAAADPAAANALALRDAVRAALEGRESWGELLRGLGRAMPDGAWLTKLNVTRAGVAIDAAAAAPVAAPSAGGAAPIAAEPATAAESPAATPSDGVTLALTGCALSQELVGRTVNEIDRLPGAREASVSSNEARGGEGTRCGKHPSFRLSFDIRGGGG